MPSRYPRPSAHTLVFLADKGCVERPTEPRVSVRQPVTVTLLEPTRYHVIEAYILNIAENGVQLRLPKPLECGTAVKIESNTATMLGQVCYCKPAEMAFLAGVQVSRTLPPAAELEQFSHALAVEAEPAAESASEPGISRR